MDAFQIMHVVAGVATVVLAVVACAWGLARARGDGKPIAGAFAQVLALSQVAVVATGLLGLAVMGGGTRPHDPLHARVYGPFMLVAIVAAWGFRTGEARWNTRVFAIAAGFVAALGVRALMTG